MQTSTQAVRARTDEPFLERFIEAHEAFVLRCASRHAGFAVTRSDDEYGFAFYDLAASSPKSDKTRRSCAAAVGTLLHSPVLFASMQSAHSLPIKALAQQCGVSARTITRHRDYIVAAALLIDGDYPILCTYLQTMRKEAEQCVR